MASKKDTSDASSVPNPLIFLFRNPSEPGAARFTRLTRADASGQQPSGTSEHSSSASPSAVSVPSETIPNTTDENEDDYSIAFKERGFRCCSIPVLEHRLCNLDKLEQAVREGVDRYCALVVTSKRAVEAWKEVWEKAGPELNDQIREAWQRKPVYVVGEGTAAPVAALGFQPLGQTSGNADKLAELIVADLSNRPDPGLGQRTVLFLSGDKRRDVLFQRLPERGIQVAEISVYATGPVTNFGSLLEAQVDQVGSPQWVAFFSPSGVDVALKPCQNSSWWSTGVKVASIGPTTSAKLREVAIDVAAEAKQPGPEPLAHAVLEASQRQ